MCDQIVNAVPQINGGTIKAYAMATPERNPSLPECADHQGSRPAGLPGPGLERDLRAEGHAAGVVAKLNAAAVKALDDEGVRKRLLDLGSVIPATAERTPAALATLVKSEIAKWTPVLKAGAISCIIIKAERRGAERRFRPLSFVPADASFFRV